MPPAVMGKDIPLSGIFDPQHARYNEAQEFRALYESDADAKRVVDTGFDGYATGGLAVGEHTRLRPAAGGRPEGFGARAGDQEGRGERDFRSALGLGFHG